MNKKSSMQRYRLFLGGSAAREDERQLEEYFSNFGEISSCLIKKHKETGRGLGYGYLNCKSKKTYNAILRQPFHTVNGRVVEVKELLAREELCGKLKEEEIRKLFVGNLSERTGNESLRTYFSSFGKVANAYILCKPGTNKSRCFGFIHFEDKVALAKVVAKKYHFIDGVKIEVDRFVGKKEQKKAQPNKPIHPPIRHRSQRAQNPTNSTVKLEGLLGGSSRPHQGINHMEVKPTKIELDNLPYEHPCPDKRWMPKRFLAWSKDQKEKVSDNNHYKLNLVSSELLRHTLFANELGCLILQKKAEKDSLSRLLF